jgi:tetratricopeptide (TPR) repeat protein
MPFFRIYFFVVLTLLAAGVAGQNGEIDSLKKVIAQSPDDTTKVKTIGELSWAYMSAGNFDTALIYAGEELAMASTPILNGSSWPKGIAYAHNTMGVVYFNKGFYPTALQHYYTALRIQEELGDKRGIASIHNGIGNIYGIQHQFELALKNHLIALEIRKEIGNKRGMANSYGNIGNIYYNSGNFAEALRNYWLSLALMKETGNQQGIANAYGNIGLVYLAQDRFDEALKSQFSSLKIHKDIGDVQGEGVTYINIALIYGKKNEFKEAETYAQKAVKICSEIGDLESMKDAYHTLSEICENTGRFGESLRYYRCYVSTRDSLLNEENTRESMRLEMNYEFEKKEAATKLEQEKKEAIAAAEKRKQKIITLVVSGFGLLVLIFAVFAYRSFLQKRNANLAIMRQKELIEEKQREILDSIHYARRIQTALLPSDKYLQRMLSREKERSN